MTSKLQLIPREGPPVLVLALDEETGKSLPDRLRACEPRTVVDFRRFPRFDFCALSRHRFFRLCDELAIDYRDLGDNFGFKIDNSGEPADRPIDVADAMRAFPKPAVALVDEGADVGAIYHALSDAAT